jgi:hypothetical protein
MKAPSKLALVATGLGSLWLAAAAPPPATMPEESGAEVGFQLGAPRTFAVDAGWRWHSFSLGASYQPRADDTFLVGSVEGDARVYFPPLDTFNLLAAYSQVFAGIGFGEYDFLQTVLAQTPSTDARNFEAKGAFVAPHLGFSLFNDKGHHLDMELGWFKPLKTTRTATAKCTDDPAPCQAATQNLPDPTPVYVRKSGLYVTLLRFVWRVY